MRIATNTKDQLILDHAPWLIGAFLILMVVAFLAIGIRLSAIGQWIAALAFICGAGLPGLTLYLVVARVQVVFDRNSGVVELRRRSYQGFETRQLPLGQIQRADLETSTFKDRDQKVSRTHRPVLVLADGTTQPLLLAYSNASDQSELVEAVNDWLSPPPGASGSGSRESH